MALPWFRMYAEAIDDEKLRLLAFEDRWHFFAILCLKAQGILDERNKQLRQQKMCVKLGLDSVELETVMKRLVTVGLVTSSYQPINWNKRQFLSDSSTSRVRAFRERSRNVSVTPSDTDTDTDTDTDKKKNKNQKAASPLVLHESLPRADWDGWLEHRKERKWPCSHRALKAQLDLLNRYDVKTQSEIIATSINAGWRGLFAPKGLPSTQRPLTWRPKPEDFPDA